MKGNRKSLSIVRLSITAESLHLGCITKQRRLQGVYVQLLEGTRHISENALWDRGRQFTVYKVKRAWSSGRHFVCISARLSARACVCVWAWLCLSVRSCVQRRLRLSNKPTWAMLLKGLGGGFNYPALFLAWDIILSLYKAETEAGPPKPLRPIVLSLSDKWEAGVHVWEGFKSYMPQPLPFRPREDLQQNTSLYDSKCTQQNHFAHWISFLFSLPLSVLCSYSFLAPSIIPLWWNTRPCASTTGSPGLANPYEGSHGSYKPSLGLPTCGSVLWMLP